MPPIRASFLIQIWRVFSVPSLNQVKTFITSSFFKINSVSGTNGVYLERWDRIDYKRIRFLLADPRYPNLPSFTTCVPTFEQPANWGDFFGSRLRTYFVPLQTGNHYFFLCKGPASICNGRLLFEIWILLMRYVNTFSKGGLPYINKNCKRL